MALLQRFWDTEEINKCHVHLLLCTGCQGRHQREDFVGEGCPQLPAWEQESHTLIGLGSGERR